MTYKKSFNASVVNDIYTVENIISNSLFNEGLSNADYMRISSINNSKKSTLSLSAIGENLEFISVNRESLKPFATIMSEKEFFKVVGVIKSGISKKSGAYQESLYGFYLQALKEYDMGFLSDILNKAVVFKNNLSYVRQLETNKKFMKEWRRNFGSVKPSAHFKNTGNLRMINIVKDRI